MITIVASALILVPILGFTLNQVALTRTGRRYARSVDDIVRLKESDAKAFTRPLLALIGNARRRSHARRRMVAGEQQPARPPLTAGHPRGPAATMTPAGPAGPAGTATRSPGQPPEAGFWGELTQAEREALLARARLETFVPGGTVWQQGDRGDRVLVIASGHARIYREDEPAMRVIATRGPGDVVGERAALRMETRSATVMAMDVVRALVVMTADFAALVAEHPRVLGLLESEIYARLIEPRPAADTAAAWAPVPGPAVRRWTGQNCSICFTDVTAFSAAFRRDRDRLDVRAAMYRMLTDAFNDGDVPWAACHREDRGDGVLIVISPSIPTGLVVEAVAGRLAAALGRHNGRVPAATRIQLRVGIHVGPVTADATGVAGHAINQAARLIEAAEVKASIAAASADLALVASEFVYETVISPDCHPAELARYRRMPIRAKGAERVAWVRLAGGAGRAAL